MKIQILFAALFSIAAVSVKAQDVDLKALEEKVNPLLEVANANPRDVASGISQISEESTEDKEKQIISTL